jgi:hypothetical protein
MKDGWVEGVILGAVGLAMAIGILILGGYAAEHSVAGRLKACMEISTPEQCVNQFIASKKRRPGN